MLGKIFGQQKEKERREGQQLSPGLRSTILNVVGANSIPSMPTSAQRAFEISTNPDAEARDFIELIESDEALSARIIKIANSVFFDRGSSSDSIEQCVNKIGINELRCLLNANTLADILPSRHPARPQLWGNDLGTALSAKILCSYLLPGKEASAFLGGLMHDIGKLLLLQRAAEDYNKVMLLVAQKTHDFCQAEEELFAFNHTELGQLIAEKWRFTPEITEIIRTHHTVEPSKSSLAFIVRVANSIAHSLGLGHAKGFFELRSAHAQRLPNMFESLAIPESDAKEIARQCQLSFESEREMYQGKDA